MQRRLQSIVQDRQKDILRMLPQYAKLSIGLDCWTSPFKQAFMAITGYFLDQEWNYREVLLGFEPLEGPHTGMNLGLVLSETLQKHHISDRIMAITTDNASNNQTMIASLQETNPSTTVIRIPCMAHVMQLSLNRLLGQMKANPQNDTVDMVWSEELNQSAHTRAKKRNIANTLYKVRNLAIYINASSQRRAAFLKLQAKQPGLVPIQDVRTRWNSTFLMLQRAKRLRTDLDQYCATYQANHLMLDADEWRHIDYLLYLTKPFFLSTTFLSKTKDVTIHGVFSLYNKLFSHLEGSIRQLKRKKVSSRFFSYFSLAYLFLSSIK
jgi:hypothetical protein